MEWTYFSICEVEQFVSLLILNGLNVSSRLEMKFKMKEEDPVNGNKLCAQVCGCNVEQRLKYLCVLFVIQDPMIGFSPRKIVPNHKINPFLSHLQKVVLECWESGSQMSDD